MSGDEQEKQTAVSDFVGQFLGPGVTGTDTLVIPDVEALIMQPLDFGIYAYAVFVSVADEDVGVITLIGCKRTFHFGSGL